MEIKIEGKEDSKKYGKYDEWEIKSLASSFLRVEEAKKDKEKMKYVEDCLEDKKEDKKMEIKSIEDLLKVGEMKRIENSKEDKKEDKKEGDEY